MLPAAARGSTRVRRGLRGSPLLAAYQVGGDDTLLDLGAAVRDEVRHHVPQALLQRQLGRVAEVAVDSHRRLDCVLGDGLTSPSANASVASPRRIGSSAPEPPYSSGSPMP